MSLTKERRCSRICPRRMRHRRCRIARFNCDGLNLMRLPRCMLWPSVSLSSLPVARLSLGDWTCVSVPSVPCAPFNDNGIRHGWRGECGATAAWVSGRESRSRRSANVAKVVSRDRRRPERRAKRKFGVSNLVLSGSRAGGRRGGATSPPRRKYRALYISRDRQTPTDRSTEHCRNDCRSAQVRSFHAHCTLSLYSLTLNTMGTL